MGEVESDEVVLRIPADAPFARIARIAAASLALREGVAIAAIDDLRLAMDEALVMLLSDPTRRAEIVEVTYRIHEDEFAVSARLGGAPGPIDGDAAARFIGIVGGLVREYTIDQDAGQVELFVDLA